MRKMIIVGNWKMNKTAGDALELIEGIRRKLSSEAPVDVVVCPSFVCLDAVKSAIGLSPIKLGAQNLHWANAGAFTGEVSADMLLSVGVEYVIIGHSERRQFFGETDETVNLRLKQALAKGLKPIVCIGETLEEREAGRTFHVLKRQLSGGLSGITAEQMTSVVLAYEPVWAIGTGKVATNEQAQEAHAYIRNQLAVLFEKETADVVIIQYGGSVKPDNARELLRQLDVDGALVGGASLDADAFTEIVAAAT